jgi:hypothetical protein
LRVVYSFFSLVLLSFLPHVSLPFQAFLSSLFGSLLFNALFFVLVVEMSSLQPVGPSLCLHWNCSPCCVPLSPVHWKMQNSGPDMAEFADHTTCIPNSNKVLRGSS